ncbi:hypothetical protein Mic7113_0267 [Allocoleopsis franciscana PCC 7113]|uniref:Uncharacterized protein n=1 Tax=Allocoleopsis franciscana PCC 7113 TaxID=1173027 RepID=K9W9M6_9CYAN|nr:hypothetical protein Mic7113_0267 [Allocoleopsis franciscana PCC 7113]
MRFIKVRRKLIFAIILLLALPFLLFFFQFSRPLPAKETPWEIITGKEKVTRFEFLSWFDQDARLYTLPAQNHEFVLTPSSPFYVFPWFPQGKEEGRYIWKLNLNPLSIQPILYDEFLVLNPQPPGELPTPIEKILQQQLDYEISKNAPSSEMIMEVIRFNTSKKTYEAKLSVSDFKRLTRRRFGTEFTNDEPRGWHTGIYYSGIMRFEISSLSEPNQPIVALKKELKNWNYPLRRNDKKLVQPSYIGAIGKLYFLPDSQPVFILFSKVYRGIYQPRKGIDDAAFSVIVP